MAFRQYLRRHSRDSRWIVGGLSALLLIITAVFYLLQRSRHLPQDLVRNRILVFVLVYINVVLILAIAFVLLRNLFKLALERHHRILGSKFKTKLVVTYIGLSLLPVLLLFLYGSQLLQGWIDRWFNETAFKGLLEQGYSVAQALTTRIEDGHGLAVARIAQDIRTIDLANPRQQPVLARHLESLERELGLDYLAVYDQTDFVYGMLRPQSGIRDLPEIDRRFLVEAQSKGQTVRVINNAQGRLILTAGVAEPGRVVVVVGTLLDPTLAAQTEQLIQAHQGYLQLEVQKGDIEASYQLVFLMVTLLILLAFSWVGLYLARRVTVPIQALAEGTRRISSGDLDHRVEVAADDELGVLVHSFNHMTAELKRNKEELLATNQRLAAERALIAAVLENMAAGVIAVDAEGRVLTCNRAALGMLRQREEEVVGRAADEAWAEGDRRKLVDLATEVSSHGRTTRHLRMVLGGEIKSFDAKVEQMRGSLGEPSGRVIVLEDMTELIKAQHQAAWSEAARRIAHEIKNPLTPIKLSAERLRVKQRQGDPQLPQAVEEAVEIIVREVEGMKGMVDEFSRFARMRAPQMQEVDVARLVEEAVHLYRGIKPGVAVDCRVDAAVERAVLDGEQIRRVLINLLDNAIEATDAPGEVSVAVAGHDGTLEIHIADTGRGIPAEAKEKLFLPHFSTKGRGTGLGLAIVHRIVADHHGTIRVEDNRPRGTVFTVELPLA